MLREKFFEESQLYDKLEAAVRKETLPETQRALPYMREKHKGQTRGPVRGWPRRVPYYAHPVLMACQAYAMGIRDDTILATALLHDVCEDCGVRPEELPFSKPVQTAVGFLTKDKDHFRAVGWNRALEEYFAQIRTNAAAMFVKCLDRCNNLSTMAGSFTELKMRDYIEETERYILPLLDIIMEKEPELSDAAFLLQYQMMGLVETQKALLKL